MDVCGKTHEEVCYEGRECPMCVLYNELQDALAEIEQLKELLTVAEDKLDDYESDFKRWKKVKDKLEGSA